MRLLGQVSQGIPGDTKLSSIRTARAQRYRERAWMDGPKAAIVGQVVQGTEHEPVAWIVGPSGALPAKMSSLQIAGPQLLQQVTHSTPVRCLAALLAHPHTAHPRW
jgi:hypothetical protein